MPVALVAVHAPSIPADELVPWSWWPLAIVVLVALFVALLTAVGAWLSHRSLVFKTPAVESEPLPQGHVAVATQPATAENARADRAA